MGTTRLASLLAAITSSFSEKYHCNRMGRMGAVIQELEEAYMGIRNSINHFSFYFWHCRVQSLAASPKIHFPPGPQYPPPPNFATGSSALSKAMVAITGMVAQSHGPDSELSRMNLSQRQSSRNKSKATTATTIIVLAMTRIPVAALMMRVLIRIANTNTSYQCNNNNGGYNIKKYKNSGSSRVRITVTTRIAVLW